MGSVQCRKIVMIWGRSSEAHYAELSDFTVTYQCTFRISGRQYYITSTYASQFFERRVCVLRRCFWLSRNASTSFPWNVSKCYPADMQPGIISRMLNTVAASMSSASRLARKFMMTEVFSYCESCTYGSRHREVTLLLKVRMREVDYSWFQIISPRTNVTSKH